MATSNQLSNFNNRQSMNDTLSSLFDNDTYFSLANDQAFQLSSQEIDKLCEDYAEEICNN